VRWLACVGRVALTNYLLTSVLCQFVFVWGPWNLYGRLEYYQRSAVILVAWSAYVLFSTLWLRYFRYGPLEWVWRSLTRWRLQPLRLGWAERDGAVVFGR
jgi:uncharacterized protein